MLNYYANRPITRTQIQQIFAQLQPVNSFYKKITAVIDFLFTENPIIGSKIKNLIFEIELEVLSLGLQVTIICKIMRH